MSAERSAAILAGREAVLIGRKSLERILVIGHAFEELQLEAMERSSSTAPIGRRYAEAYGRLEKPVPELFERSIDKTARSRYLQCWQNREKIAAWWATVPQNQRDRWGHPQAVLQQWKKATQPKPLEAADGEPSKRRPALRIVDVAERMEATSEVITGRFAAAGERMERKAGIEPHSFYDLSPEMVDESVQNFLEVHTAEGVARFIVAALNITAVTKEVAKLKLRKAETGAA